MSKFISGFFLSAFFAVIMLVGCSNHSISNELTKKMNKSSQYTSNNSLHSSSKYAYLYGLSGYKFADLAGEYSPKVAVVDVDDSQLNSSQISKLRSSGKIIFSYLSIGEAENYRDYWQGWDNNKPAFLLKENENWKGNFLVKFWDKNWQNLIINKAGKIAEMGFNGVYLDIVDGYQEKQVQKAYPGSKDSLRREMENFVIRISNHVKRINPNFKVIPQNAVELVADIKNTQQPNINYLRAIDGMGVEDLWYDDDDIADWTKYDLQYIRIAKSYGKFVLATSYPKSSDKRRNFIRNSIREGFIPFAGKRSLSKKEKVYELNREILGLLPDNIWSGVR